MENKEISFNYFYIMFQKQLQNKYQEFYERRANRIKNNSISISTEDLIEYYNDALYEVCLNYIQLSNSKIDIIPNDVFEFIHIILSDVNESKYTESFLISIQFIYQNYFEILGRISPVLMTSDDNNSISTMEIVLDSNNRILQFESKNMEMIEQDILMTKLLEMETNHKQGPLPKVLYKIRKDI